MKKTLIALGVLSAVAGVAQAQTNVTIYGVMDTGFVKKTGHDVSMEENVNSRIGFRGVEDLGNGQAATFQLEKRFNVNDGTNNSSKGKDWEGAANVGLKGNNWGAVRLGRLHELPTEAIRKFDPFYQYGVGNMINSTQRSSRIDNTIRFDSLNYSGFRFGATYSLGRNTNSDSIDANDIPMKEKGADNDGYAIMLGYDNGPLSLVGNWSRLADSNKSSVWNLGAAYRFGDAKVELVYQQTKDKGYKLGSESSWTKAKTYVANGGDDYVGANSLTEKQWLLGLEWKLGPGRLNASAQWMQLEANGKDVADADIYKYALGYTYDISKRTAIYGNVAYTDYENDNVARVFGDVNQSTTGVQVGITHKF